MKGVREMIANMERLARDTRRAKQRALTKFANIEMTEMKKRTPVATGTLRDSGIVDPPTWNGDTVTVTLGFGGAAEQYAIYVHEDLEAFHPVGQAKFVESVLNESERYFESRIRDDIKSELGL
jgi:HK97 gp10 family phage protein